MNFSSSRYARPKLALVLSCLVAGWWLQGSASAQPPRPSFEMMRKIGEECPDHEIFELLNHRPVCEELGLSEDVCDAIWKRNKQVVGQLRNVDLEDREERIKKVVEILTANSSQTRALLNDSQIDRLLGLFVQSRKHGAAANRLVAERIGLEEEELENFRNALEEIMVDGMTGFVEKAREIYRNTAPSATRAEVEKLRDQHFGELDMEIKKLLSEGQTAKLNKLKGPEFADLPPMFGSRGRRGGGRNRDRGRNQDGQRSEAKQDEDREGKKQSDRERNQCCSKPHDGMPCYPASM